MIKRFLNIFAAPANMENDKTNQAWLLAVILLPTMAVTLLVGVVDPSLGYLRLFPAVLFGIELIAFVLLLLRKVMAAAIFFIGSAWLVVFYMAYLLGGLDSAVLYFSIAILLLSGILVGNRFAVFVLFANLIAITAFLYLGAMGSMPQVSNPTTPLRRWSAYIGTYILVSVLAHLSLVVNRRALQQAHQQETELEASNLELQDIRANLEQHVQDRTQDLERRAVQLQAAAEVGRLAASLRSLDDLLLTVTHLISERFGFYHTGIFLLDSTGEYAVLRAANSEGGQRMLARNHHLKVGETGIVGYVTEQRKPRIALDVGRDATYFDNPDLPETRSELALPLLVGDTVLGALDVQSKMPSAFGQDDLEVLQVLADLIAIAIENAQLLTENQAALDTARRAYREMSQQAWNSFLRQRSKRGYISTREATQDAEGEPTPEMKQAYKNGEMILAEETLALPIKIRANTTGVLRLKKIEEGRWTEKELGFVQDLTEQLSQALEAARLYTESQQRAERERMAAEIVNRMRSSNDPQLIIQNTLTELRRALDVKNAKVQFDNIKTAVEPNENGSQQESGMPWEPQEQIAR